jgi:hypothetical protein
VAVRVHPLGASGTPAFEDKIDLPQDFEDLDECEVFNDQSFV